MSVKTANYVTSEDHKVGWTMDAITIPKGTFVKPIDVVYIPAHLKEGNEWATYKDKLEYYTYAYSSYGIHIYPRRIIVEI